MFDKIAKLFTGDETYSFEIKIVCASYNSQLTHGTNLNRSLINFIPEESMSFMEEVLHSAAPMIDLKVYERKTTYCLKPTTDVTLLLC